MCSFCLEIFILSHPPIVLLSQVYAKYSWRFQFLDVPPFRKGGNYAYLKLDDHSSLGYISFRSDLLIPLSFPLIFSWFLIILYCLLLHVIFALFVLYVLYVMWINNKERVKSDREWERYLVLPFFLVLRYPVT